MIKTIYKRLALISPAVCAIAIVQLYMLFVPMYGETMKTEVKISFLKIYLYIFLFLIVFYGLFLLIKKNKILSRIFFVLIFPALLFSIYYYVIFCEGIIYNITHKEIMVEIKRPDKVEFENFILLKNELLNFEKDFVNINKKNDNEIKIIRTYDYSDSRFIKEAEQVYSKHNEIICSLIQNNKFSNDFTVDKKESVRKDIIFYGYLNTYLASYYIQINNTEKAVKYLNDLDKNLNKIINMKYASALELSAAISGYARYIDLINKNSEMLNFKLLDINKNLNMKADVRNSLKEIVDFEYISMNYKFEKLFKDKFLLTFPFVNERKFKNERYINMIRILHFYDMNESIIPVQRVKMSYFLFNPLGNIFIIASEKWYGNIPEKYQKLKRVIEQFEKIKEEKNGIGELK